MKFIQKSFFKWGVIGGLGAAIFSLIMHIMNVSYDSKLLYLGYFILVGVILAGTYEFRDKENNGMATIGGILKNAALLCLVYAVLSAIWTILYAHVINPDFISEMLLRTKIDMEERGIEKEQMEMSLKIAKMMMHPISLFFTTVLFTMTWGMIIALPISFALQKGKSDEQIIREKIEEQE